MATTPLIKKIQTTNGTFYAFQSAINDGDIAIAQNGYTFQFSKYALLNIPKIGRPLTDDTEKQKIIDEATGSTSYDFSNIPNTVQFNAVGDTVIGEDKTAEWANTTEQSEYLAESFQNYCLNMESVLLSQDTYSRKAGLHTVSERIFFKWLKETGAIRYEEASSNQNSLLNFFPTDTDKRYIEEVAEEDSKYNKVVQYINDIQSVNANTSQITCTEIYIYIPTEQGSSPYVLFKSEEDANYHSYTKTGTDDYNEYTVPYAEDESENYLCGRTNNDHPEGLIARPYYDSDKDMVGSVTSTIIATDADKNDVTFDQDFWFTDTQANAYYTDMEDYFTKPLNLLIDKKTSDKDILYARTTLDGVGIDFNVSHYAIVSEDPYDSTSSTTLNDLNTSDTSKSFTFNAILLYYDLINESNPDDSYTNLYGVYFIDAPSNVNTWSEIPYDTKYKPTSTSDNTINGNALAYKINFKSDSSYDNSVIIPTFHTQTSGNYNTFSMDLFVDVMNELRELSLSYADNLEAIKDATKDIESYRNIMVNSENTIELNEKIEKINDKLDAAKEYIGNSKSLLNMVDNIYDDYAEIVSAIKENKPIEWKYDINPASVNAVVEHTQAFNIDSSSYKFDFTTKASEDSGNVYVLLNKYSNYIKHVASKEDIEVTEMSQDIYINIDDRTNNWKPGQSFRIVFGEDFDPAEYSIYVMTKAVKKTDGTVKYENNIVELNSDDFEDSKNPIFDIICVDPTNYVFEVDKLR